MLHAIALTQWLWGAAGGTIPAPYDNDRWEQDIRRGFVRKVLLLVAIQLLITTGVSIAFFTVQPIKVRTVSFSAQQMPNPNPRTKTFASCV